MKQQVHERLSEIWTKRGFIKQTADELGINDNQVSYHLNNLVSEGKAEGQGEHCHRQYRVADNLGRGGTEFLASTIIAYWAKRGYEAPKMKITPLSRAKPSSYTLRSDMYNGLPRKVAE